MKGPQTMSDQASPTPSLQHPGPDHLRTLPIRALNDLAVPYFDIPGQQDGPLLTILAGIHGCEYTSIAAARRFALSLRPADVAGRIVVVPIVNIPAFWARCPFVVPADQKNLNRCFPGNPHGTFTDILADAVFEQFIRGSDFVVDMHAGDLPEALEPFTIFDESPVEDAAQQIAAAYGLPHTVRQPTSGRTVGGSTSAAAADAGIPAIIAEAGGNGLLAPEAVSRHLAGITNVARALHLIDGMPTPVAPPRRHEGWEWIHTDAAGWWQPSCAVGDHVEPDAVLGTLDDPWGHPGTTITAPVAGTILFLTTSPAIQHNGLLLGLARDRG